MCTLLKSIKDYDITIFIVLVGAADHPNKGFIA